VSPPSKASLALWQRALRGEQRQQQHEQCATHGEDEHAHELVRERDVDAKSAAKRRDREDLEGEDREIVEGLGKGGGPHDALAAREDAQHLKVAE